MVVENLSMSECCLGIDKYYNRLHSNVIPAQAGIQSSHSSYRDLIAVSKLIIKLDPVVKPRDDAADEGDDIESVRTSCNSNAESIYP